MLDPGTRIADRYTLVRELGEGGMGMVYEVREDSLGNRFALKIIRDQHTGNSTLRSRFEREARILATLSHPGVTRVIELVEHEGMPAMVMEFVDAPTLRERLDKGRPPLDVVRKVMTDILSALVAVHNAGVVHRDLKPDNIFVLIDQSNQIRCKLIDFGIAKHEGSQANPKQANLTRDAAFVGTYVYASPEQITQSSTVDQRTDLYSLGVILWEMLAGVPIYADLASVYAVQKAVITEPLPMLPDDVPGDLKRIVAELTRKAPGERPQSAKEVLAMFEPSSALSQSAKQGEEALWSGPRAALPPTLPDTPAQSDALSKSPKEASKTPDSKPQVPAREGSVSPLMTPAPLTSRILARLQDELIPQLLVLTCVGIVAYPVMVMGRGLNNAQSTSQEMYSLQILNVKTGEPASRTTIMVRNAVDLFLWQLPLLGVTSPLSWFFTGLLLPLFAGAWFAVVMLMELILAATVPGGRRLTDLICSTQVCRK